MTIKAMIIEDEPFVRIDLRHMLSAAHRDVQVLWETGTISEAKELLTKYRPDVIYLDVRLRGGTGFELVPHIHPSTHIVFVTAYDEYAVRAFEINALDYILKPITEERLADSLERLRNEIVKGLPISEQPGPFQPDDLIFIKADSEQLFVRPDGIKAVSSVGGNYTSVHLREDKSPLVRRTLKEWEKMLPEPMFLRIHRLNIINKLFIESVRKDESGSWNVYLSGHEKPFPVSRRRTDLLKELA